MNFKFFRGEDTTEIRFLPLEPTQILTLRPQTINNVEYCFQFDDDEPRVFASGSERLTLNIEPRENGNIIFQNQGRRFKIFARERQQ